MVRWYSRYLIGEDLVLWMSSGFQVDFLFLCFTCSEVGGTVLVSAFVLHSPVSRKCLREVASELLSPIQGLGHVRVGGGVSVQVHR